MNLDLPYDQVVSHYGTDAQGNMKRFFDNIPYSSIADDGANDDYNSLTGYLNPYNTTGANMTPLAPLP